MRELHELPSKLKQSEWFSKVNQALKEIKIVNVREEEDTSPIMILKGLVSEFLTRRAPAETKDQILVKRVYFDKVKREYVFRVKDLTEFLWVQKQFRYFGPQELHGILREWEAAYKQMRLDNGRQVRVAILSVKYFESTEEKEIFSPDFSKYTEKEDF
jgi:hypothetical protein